MGGGFNAGTMQAKMGERRDKGGRPVNLPSLKRPPPRVSCLCHILSVTAPSFDGINIGKICQPPFVETTPFADHIPSQEVLFSLYFWIKERDLSPKRPFQEYIFIFTLPMILALLCSIPLSISKSEQQALLEIPIIFVTLLLIGRHLFKSHPIYFGIGKQRF